MKLKETNVSIWMGLRSPIGENELFLKQFLESQKAIMEVEGWEGNYTDVYSCAATLTATAKRTHLGVKASTRKGRVFLINTSLYKEEEK